MHRSINNNIQKRKNIEKRNNLLLLQIKILKIHLAIIM